MRVKLTDTALRALKPREKRYTIMDTLTPGLGVRVSIKGTLSFVLIARFGNSTNPTRRTLGEYPALTLEAARDKARDWRKTIKRGDDPALLEEQERRERLRQQAQTFGVVADEYFEHIKRQKQRRAKETEACIRREFVTRWERRPITSITRREVVEVIQLILRRGASAAARKALANLRQLFNWAIEVDIYGLEHSPCDRIKPKRLIGKKPMRTHILTDVELFAYWRAAGRLPYPYGPFLKILALTLQRRNEVARGIRPELDFHKGVWTIPAERMKSNVVHVAPLSKMALALIEDLPNWNAGDFLFSTTGGERPISGFSKYKKRLDARMLLTLKALARRRGEDPKRVTLTPFVLHDVRRTGRTALSALKVPEDVRELVIAHSRPGLHQVYDQHEFLDEKREALERWSAHLRGIVEPVPENVVRLVRSA